MSLKNKESGLYIDNFGTFLTELEYIKEWCGEIVGENGDDFDFCEEHGVDYDLDDDEVYEDFLWSFQEKIDRNRKDGFTIDLNTDDLQKSQVSLPRSKYKYDFEECDFETTTKILEGLEIEYLSKDFDCDFDVNDSCDYENYIIYVDKGELVIKLETTDSNFTLQEFIDYNTEMLNDSPDYQITKEAITDRVLKDFGSIKIDKTSELYQLFELKYADSNELGSYLLNTDVFYIDDGWVRDENLNKIIHSGMNIGGITFNKLVIDQYNKETLEQKLDEKLKAEPAIVSDGKIYQTFSLADQSDKTFIVIVSLDGKTDPIIKNKSVFNEFVESKEPKGDLDKFEASLKSDFKEYATANYAMNRAVLDDKEKKRKSGKLEDKPKQENKNKKEKPKLKA